MEVFNQRDARTRSGTFNDLLDDEEENSSEKRDHSTAEKAVPAKAEVFGDETAEKRSGEADEEIDGEAGTAVAYDEGD